MKYGKLTIIGHDFVGRYKILCRCDCGNEKFIYIYNVKSGNTTSCGCERRERMRIEASKRFKGKRPANYRDFTGEKIGVITVLRRIKDARPHTTTYECQCECGTKFNSEISNVRRGKYDYCVCGPEKHPLKSVLRGMRDRCTNPNSDSYHWYGRKGIKVCEEWDKYPIKFIEWSERNGWSKKVYTKKKDALTIDRIDSNKGYSPENCQWITLSMNSIKANQERWNKL